MKRQPGKGARRSGVCAIVPALLAVLGACAHGPDPTAGPSGASAGTVQPPGNDIPIDRRDDRLTFVVFSDLTGGEREGVFDVAAEQIRLLRPDFVVNVGDLIEGAEQRDAIDGQWDAFEARARRTGVPVFYTGGNHDLLGVAMRDAWAERFGPRHFHFLVENALFIVLDTDDYEDDRLAEIARLRREAFEVAETRGWDAFAETPYARLPENRAGEISRAQAADVLEVLAAYPDVRWTFLLMHKAPWLREDMATWRAIEDALSGRRHTVFHGHEHAYRHQVRNGADYIQLGTTGGVPLPENGQAMDHLVLVTVEDRETSIANLLLGGVLDRTGRIPTNGGHERCFARTLCGESP